MRKIRTVSLLLAALLFLSGCSYVRGKIQAEDRLSLPQETPQAELAPEKSGRGSSVVYLYYQVKDLMAIAAESRVLNDVSEDELLSAVVRELLKGPKDPELSTWFPVDTTLAELSQTRDIVYVTLSEEFLNAPPEAPVNWEDDPEWTAYVLQRRRLALDCLVDTVTQLGGISRTQILVRTEGGRGVRLTLHDLGLEGEDPTQPLPPLTREDTLIFTPEMAAEELLSAFARKEWGQVASWTAKKDPIYGENEDAGMLALTLSSMNPSLLTYEILDSGIISGDTAVVTVKLEEAGETGMSTVYDSVPLRFVLDGSLWKIAPISLEQLVTNAQ